MSDPASHAAAAQRATEASRLGRVSAWAVKEFKLLAVVFLYLYVCYAILNLHERMVLAQYGININILGLAAINALILAKVMLIAEELGFARLPHHHPLILAIVAQALGFAVLFITFHIVEHVVIALVEGRAFAQSIPPVGGLSGIIGVATIMSIMLLPYFAYRELGRAVGEKKLHALLFHRRPRAE